MTDEVIVRAADLLPVDLERERLRVLHQFGVLDTAPEVAFDDLAALAGQLCGTPIALVSLVDEDRQWFKARLGLDVCETSRESSFCAHALGSPDLFVVADTWLDPRFADNPLVTGEPGIRFYAGAPLVTWGGATLGTLCVIDVVPRTLSPRQLEQLRMLGRQVVDQLELRRQREELAAEIAARTLAEEGLRKSRLLFDDVVAHADVAVYAKDLDGRFLLANGSFEALVGSPAREILGFTDHDLFPTTEADGLVAQDRRVAQGDKGVAFTHGLPHPDGTVHRFRTTRFPLVDAAGEVYAVAGVSTDVTELDREMRGRKESEQRWRALVEHSPVAVAVIGTDALFAYANPRAAALYGAQDASALIGRPARDFVPERLRDETAEMFSSVLGGGEVLGSRWTLRREDGADVPVEVNAAAIRYFGESAVQIELRDMTVQDAAEGLLRASEARFRALFENSPVGTSECLPDGTIVQVNELMCEMLGYTSEELVGRQAGILLADSADVANQEQDVASLTHQNSYCVERVYRRKSGEQVPVLVGVGVVRDAAGATQRILATVVDLTRQAVAERELRRARDDLADRQAFTDAVLGSVDVGIVACDASGHLTLFNDASRAWHGLALTEVAAQLDPAQFPEYFDLYDSEGNPMEPDQVPLVRALADGSVSDVELLISPTGLPSTRVLCNGRALKTPDDVTVGAVIAMTDVTELRARTRALQANEQRFRTTFTNDPAGLALIAPDGRPVQVNPALCDLVGRGEAELLAACDLLELMTPGDRREVAALCRQAFREPGSSLVSERQVLHRDGHPVWVLLTVTQLPDPDEGACLLIQVENIDTKKEMERRLTHQALHDGLTGLPNRLTLHDRATHAVARLQRGAGRGMTAMFFCDLDGFKAVNDEHGHAAGDAVLVEVAERLTDTMRPDDTVARLGGDEFVLLCEDLSDPAEARRIAERVERAIAAPIHWRGLDLTVTASLGIARATPSVTADELIRQADTAMYQAKRLGKNRSEVFDEELGTRASSRFHVESLIRTALREDRVEVLYQPIFDLASDRVRGAEALVRIRREDGTMAMPDSFIPVAEDSGLIVELGTRVLTGACRAAAQWHRDTGQLTQVAVNLSGRQATRSDLPAVVAAALACAALPAQALALELTETALLEASRSTLGRLHELRDMGVEIGIDDFGTGYASLRYLRELPVSFIKVDRSFVAGMLENREDRIIVDAVIGLAEQLGLKCIVEGVETPEQLARVRGAGVHAQGYLLGRPGTGAELATLLHRQGAGAVGWF